MPYVGLLPYTSWIHFRNPHSIGPVCVQAFMILCGVLIIVGLIYVSSLVISIAIHHLLYDRDPKAVPRYVKESVQFSSDSEMDENNDNDNNRENESSSESTDEQHARRDSAFTSNARKLANLDKFMNHDMDVKIRSEKK